MTELGIGNVTEHVGGWVITTLKHQQEAVRRSIMMFLCIPV